MHKIIGSAPKAWAGAVQLPTINVFKMYNVDHSFILFHRNWAVI